MQHRSPRLAWTRLLLVTAAVLPTSILAAAQAVPPQDLLTVNGTVVDAVSGAPVSRALVKFGDRASLTDAAGRFSFAAVDPATPSISAIKPGYSSAPSPNERGELSLKPANLSDPVELRLYPDALIKGTVTGDDDEPLPNITVNALRLTLGDIGRRWSNAAVTHTNSRGQYRLPLPAGDYRIQTAYTRANGTSAICVLGRFRRS
jgi:hypothetical protein